MTPKEKAKELIYKYKSLGLGIFDTQNKKSKECAIICVDEIINSFYNTYYWKDVKKEIEKYE